MTNLTEQMKQATLPNNINYYYRINDCEPDISYGANIVNMYHNSTRNFEMEVLAEVPSYEEYMRMVRLIAGGVLISKENTKLKELLDDCRLELGCYDYEKTVRELVAKIEQVLQENK